MSKQAVLEAALQLSADEREEIADRLYASLHGIEGDGAIGPRFQYEAEWTAEIERRVKEIREGQAKLIPWEETMARARDIIDEARRR